MFLRRYMLRFFYWHSSRPALDYQVNDRSRHTFVASVVHHPHFWQRSMVSFCSLCVVVSACLAVVNLAGFLGVYATLRWYVRQVAVVERRCRMIKIAACAISSSLGLYHEFRLQDTTPRCGSSRASAEGCPKF